MSGFVPASRPLLGRDLKVPPYRHRRAPNGRRTRATWRGRRVTGRRFKAVGASDSATLRGDYCPWFFLKRGCPAILSGQGSDFLDFGTLLSAWVAVPKPGVGSTDRCNAINDHLKEGSWNACVNGGCRRPTQIRKRCATYGDLSWRRHRQLTVFSKGCYYRGGHAAQVSRGHHERLTDSRT